MKIKPYIRLSGNWLDEIGFKIGAKFNLTIENKKLIMEIKEDGNE